MFYDGIKVNTQYNSNVKCHWGKSSLSVSVSLFWGQGPYCTKTTIMMKIWIVNKELLLISQHEFS